MTAFTSCYRPPVSPCISSPGAGKSASAAGVSASTRPTRAPSVESSPNDCAVSKFKLYRAIRQQTGTAYGAYEWGGELVPDEGASQACNTGVVYTIHAYDS